MRACPNARGMLSHESGQVVTEKNIPRFRIYVKCSKIKYIHQSLSFSELTSLHVLLQKYAMLL